MDDLAIVLNQMKREAIGIDAVNVNPEQALKALICDAYSEPCFICDHKPDTVGIYFVPEELGKFNQKIIFYSLCADCKMDVTTPEVVEEKFAAHLQQENDMMGVA